MHEILVGIGFLAATCSIGAAFTFGVALVCQMMKWAPVNIKINVIDKPEVM